MFPTWKVDRPDQVKKVSGRWSIQGRESRQLALLKNEIEVLRAELGDVARHARSLADNEEAQRLSRKLDQLIVRFLWVSRASQAPCFSRKCSLP